MDKNYAVLHAHTTNGSVGDSVLKVKDYIKKAKALGITHIAITDHGSLGAMVEFHEECLAAGITGIIGMEAYVVPDRTVHDKDNRFEYSHLVLLAKNADGVKNLIRIHNDAQINGFYYKPRTDLSMLKKYGKNIIALSACVGGDIPQAILAKDSKKALWYIKQYRECFDQFYLEIQPGHFEEQRIVNDCIVQLARYTKTPIVATNDIHYLNSDDYIMHNYHLKSNADEDDSISYPDTCYYLMSRTEIRDYFLRTKYVTDNVIDEALDNTNVIATQCDGNIEYRFKMPQYLDLPEGETEDSYLTKLCIRSLKQKEQFIADPAMYEDRLSYELDTIKTLGFSGYFLIVYDFLKHAREVGIAVGPGRGSVAGSLVAYLLNITVADPIKYGLLFERFLSANRKSLPDIDLDYSSERRAEMKEYVVEKYGKNHCALVGTFQGRKAKDAIRAAARVLGLDVAIADEVCKAMPFNVRDDEGEKISSPTLQQMIDSSTKLQEKQTEYPELFEAALNMESFPKALGSHAAGIVISPDDIMDKIPVRVDKNGQYVAMVTKKYIEKLAIKYDFLGLSTMSVIDKTCHDVKANINLNDDDFFTDKKVWDAIGSKYTTGMFQISSTLYKQRMPRLHPQTIKQLAACLALVRGPCISAKTDEIYMQVVEGKRKIEKIDPRYDAITESTNGICIYQEQIMKLGVAFGFTIDDSYKLMKAISKKKIDVIKGMKDDFIKKATALGVSSDIQERIFKIIEDAGLYSFNASHALSYAIVSYLSAWLKVYYPKEFMANLLTNVYVNNKDDKKIEEAVNDCRRLGLKFLPVDANKSDWEFKAEEDGIRIGFCAIKSFGEKAAADIISLRPVSFESIIDIMEKDKALKSKNKVSDIKDQLVSVPNKKSMIVLILSGAFDSENDNKREMLYKLLDVKKTKKSEKIEVPDSFTVCKNCTIELDGDETDNEAKLLRANFIHADVAGMPPTGFDDHSDGDSFEAEVVINRVRNTTDRRGQKMAFLKFTGIDASFDGIIFGSVYSKLNSNEIRKGHHVKIRAKKDNGDSCIVYSLSAVS